MQGPSPSFCNLATIEIHFVDYVRLRLGHEGSKMTESGFLELHVARCSTIIQSIRSRLDTNGASLQMANKGEENEQSDVPLLRATVTGKEVDTEALWDLPTIKVVAPSDMYSGYQFVVDVCGKGNATYLVEVPKNVRCGSTFEARVVERVNESAYDNAIPVGAWRHGLWNCKGGWSCLNGFCCPFFALGQIQSRLKKGSKGIFWVSMILSVVHFIQRYSGVFFEEGSPEEVLNGSFGCILALLLVFVIVRLRLALADRYAIQSDCCTETATACFCTPCTVIQMLQHTSPYGGANPTNYCTLDGLESTTKAPEHGKMAPKFIVTDPMTV